MKKISQSFLSDMIEYIAGDSCGHLMRAKWIDGKLLELDSKAAKLGSYFEFVLTGALPKNGIEPKPEMMVSGKDMLAPYRLVHTNVDRVRQYFSLMGLKILKAGVKLTRGKFEGTIDLLVECQKKVIFRDGFKWKKGDKLVLDIKYSGLIEDRWNKFGWALMGQPGSNIQKDYHGVQGKHYHMITGLPFYFLVVSSTNDTDIKLFRLEFGEGVIERHIMEANNLEEKLRLYNDIGWEPRPDISKCAECPLREGCHDRSTYPQIENVILE